jgi:hypothetical protein
MRQVFVNNQSAIANSERICALLGSSTLNTTSQEANLTHPWSVPGTLVNFRVVLSVAPGSGNSVTITVRKNGSDSAMAITIANTDTAGVYTGTLSVADGDRLILHWTTSGTPTVGSATWAIEFDSTNAKEHGYSGICGAVTNSTTQYAGLFCNEVSWDATNGGTHIEPMAIAATIKKLRFRCSNFVSGGGSLVFCIMLNGVAQDGSGGTVDTRVTVPTVGSGAGQMVSSSFSLPVVPGDEVYLRKTVSGTVSVGQTMSVSMLVESTYDGQFQFTCRSTALSSSSTQYTAPDRSGGSSTTESNSAVVTRGGITPIVLFKCYVRMDGDAGVGNDYTFSYRRNTATPSGTPSIQLAGAGSGAGITQGNDQAGVLGIVQDDVFNVRAVPVSLPTSRTMVWSAAVQVGTAQVQGGGYPAWGMSLRG